MSTVLVLGGLWALVGVPLVVRLFQERRELPMEEFQRVMGALSGPGPLPNGHVAISARAAGRRRLIAILTYVPGVLFVVVGVALDDNPVMALGVGLLNLGTVHRLVAFAIDRSHGSWPRPVLGGRPSLGTPASPSLLEESPRPLDPGVDEGPGDAHAGGDGWKIIGPEPRRIDDLVLVDADVS